MFYICRYCVFTFWGRYSRTDIILDEEMGYFIINEDNESQN